MTPPKALTGANDELPRKHDSAGEHRPTFQVEPIEQLAAKAGMTGIFSEIAEEGMKMASLNPEMEAYQAYQVGCETCFLLMSDAFRRFKTVWDDEEEVRYFLLGMSAIVRERFCNRFTHGKDWVSKDRFEAEFAQRCLVYTREHTLQPSKAGGGHPIVGSRLGLFAYYCSKVFQPRLALSDEAVMGLVPLTEGEKQSLPEPSLAEGMMRLGMDALQRCGLVGEVSLRISEIAAAVERTGNAQLVEEPAPQTSFNNPRADEPEGFATYNEFVEWMRANKADVRLDPAVAMQCMKRAPFSKQLAYLFTCFIGLSSLPAIVLTAYFTSWWLLLGLAFVPQVLLNCAKRLAIHIVVTHCLDDPELYRHLALSRLILVKRR